MDTVAESLKLGAQADFVEFVPIAVDASEHAEGAAGELRTSQAEQKDLVSSCAQLHRVVIDLEEGYAVLVLGENHGDYHF